MFMHAALLCITSFIIVNTVIIRKIRSQVIIVQELCESRGGRPGLAVLTSLLVSVDVKLY